MARSNMGYAIGGLALVLALYAGYSALPDLVRYLRIHRM